MHASDLSLLPYSFSSLLMSELVAREAENYQAPGKATLQLIELVVVPGSCSSE